jgi:mannose-6-phosphate isomerase-like protein (cupin superfamily)
VREGDAVIIPAGTYHNVVNHSKTTPLKLYTGLFSTESSERNCAQDEG